MDNQIKHLEMIQGIITRMASNSFALKGWAVTIVTGIFVLAAKEALYTYFLISYIPIVLFWIMDSYYLSMERRYRVLYKKCSQELEGKPSFNLAPPLGSAKDKTLFYQSFLSRTECGFYFPLALLIVVVIVISAIK